MTDHSDDTGAYKYSAPRARTIETGEDVFLLLAAEAAGLAESHLWRIDLDAQNRVLGKESIVDRGADTIIISPRSVFRGALARDAAKVVLAYNRPSQDLTLTDNDHILKDLMGLAGECLGMKVYDQVILTDKTYFSFKEAGLL